MGRYFRLCEECGFATLFGLDAHLSWCPAVERARADAFETKVAGILADGLARLQTEAKPDTDTVSAEVRPAHAHGAPVAVVGTEREAEARGYQRALDASLQAGHQSLKEIGEQSGLTVADVLRLAREALAENRDRLGVEASVAVGRNGEG